MTKNGKLYLKQNVMVEPLIDNWYAWSHLISPATAAMNIVHRHLKIMESYINAPQIHANAAKNPALLGGPFVDYEQPRVEEVKELIQKAKKERSHMIEFAQALKELDDILKREAVGFSLEPLYDKIPEPLQGFVELVYDLNNNPAFRLIEPLLYRSSYYQPEAQGLVLSFISQDERPFVLSTPRLIEEDDVPIHIPFSHEGVDKLFRMKREPQTFSYIKEALGIEDQYDDKFMAFLTPEPPPRYNKYEGPGLRWRYFGHACILAETKDITILSDPVLSYTYESDISRYTYADLPDVIDYVLITHNHQDHILFETLLQIRHKVKHIVIPRNGGGALQDPSLRLMLKNIGCDNVIELDEMDTIEFAGGYITGVPFFGEHSDLDIRTKLAYFVQLNKHSIMFAADSCNVEPKAYEYVHKSTGDLDVLFLGMECDGAPLSWVYGALLTQPLERKKDHSRRLSGSNYQRGIDIVNRFNCKDVYVYAMGQEPWLNYIMRKKYTEESDPIIASNKLIEDCRSRGIEAERLFGEKEILLL